MLEELLEKLKSGGVKFSYAKKEGEERVAFGTLNPNMIPVLYSGPQIQALYETAENVLQSSDEDRSVVDEAMNLMNEALKPFRPKPKRESSGEKKSSNYISYYDFEAKGFRLFNPDSLIKIY